MTDPIRPTDDGARAQARRLLDAARHGALGVIGADGLPMVSRVALRPMGADLLLLVSDLSRHAAPLGRGATVSLLIGEAGAASDPLAAPRLTLAARPLPEDKAARREAWLEWHPKAALYYEFADFRMLRLETLSGFLVGGFGRAFDLRRADLENPDPAA